ncbi:hypothetical protein PPERSA_03426 [Pseudocohnilembus persalinus]|uniref:Uncharacterized protein n=1 Tax=Pseudocohnilembus persalinus TaxID=266149 RepID=A0A0V0QBN4_PSEPJ|nr:hypothetical protein PPERSA_03426 [Pseudocohnilembus persalinus]|eukprot:KRW99625.1 hypothetical protein PPERSA_03426 [Pseudocohnilembus persalinus]
MIPIHLQQIRVIRYCSSKTGYFPSGIITLITQPLFGYAYRHEYIILKTKQCLIKICVPNQSLKNRNNREYTTPKIYIQILQLHDFQQNSLDENKLYEENKNL